MGCELVVVFTLSDKDYGKWNGALNIETKEKLNDVIYKWNDMISKWNDAI